MVREKNIWRSKISFIQTKWLQEKSQERAKKDQVKRKKKPSKTKQDQANNERLAQIAFIMQTNYTYILVGASEILRQDTVHDSYQM